ncbi:zinc finger protein Eos isoform X2 [Mus musculus]|uniref:IKAROS family zinc finger 4 n=1 Tax=Mus spicilegus TaxID=10103 RepID=A0A8C6MP09_MUSSI|nr:zinc finger protein Eos isoform X2 [Mus musculus]XP_011241742.1 zinc finger protein Eos isoform X2 [Mus musculus]XP_030100934.1 zinc finger protein Eos isoform X2 [Mus musculus]XP_030100935.1 zinc finger protein Eos isoform X2 [Mus musculus]XP_030100936.1 zinc finger protein Eos isoform X2 [Mus musculus]XP_030100937.1 zinc finger protein Eos isoform X2 [Mus musculus]XP_036011660.1 zinc finger protein Eos isoform X2 [Mus musculus]|eukprot:XP_006513675.1 PREDICTED: zinc finger protein Eos isoform X2 [Mus musculus]
MASAQALPAIRSLLQGSGDSSLEKEFLGAPVGPSVSTPNSQHSSPSRSLSANSIKVEMYSDEESSRLLGPDERLLDKDDSVIVEDSLSEPLGYCDGSGPEPHSPGGIRLPNGKLKCDVCGMVCIGPNVLMVHKRSHTGERPFHCNQCGASFTQKGNLLRHIKLHSGEKPFKCPFCNYACRRRDALTGHLRTHSVSSPTVGKPYKCNYCGRSYKQQSTLEEHKERCHNYLQSLSTDAQALTGQPGDEIRDLEMVPDSMLHPSTERPTFIDRLANSLTKRKRSTPQKFVGEKQMRFSLSDLPYDVNASGGYEKDVELVAHHGLEPGFGGSLAFVGTEHLRPLRLPPTNCISELTPVISSVYTQMQPIPSRLELPGSREAGEGPEDLGDGGPLLYRARGSLTDPGASPSNGCQDSTDTESNHEDRIGGVVSLPQGPPPQPPPTIVVGRHSPAYAKEDPKPQEGLLRGTPGPSKEVLRVVGESGEPVKAFKCEHCRILFLDHVMFTIHMGCHGFRDPFECNICGYHSQDRYEFSSHIVRGEHKVG